MMRRSAAVLAAGAALWLAVACLDIASPVTGITATTLVLLPTPSVVAHDSLRDTLGGARPLQVFAFAPNGDTVRDVIVRFFAVDTSGKLHVDSLSGFAWGDSLSPIAQVVARLTPANGKGVIQTSTVRLPVVPKPASATKGNDTTFEYDPATTDSLGAGLLSPPLTVKVQGTADTVIQSYVVSYQIVRQPPTNNPGSPAVVILDRSGNDSTIAITDQSGVASRQLRVRLSEIPSSVSLGQTDTVVVKVRVLYLGKALPMPVDSFIIPIKGKPF